MSKRKLENSSSSLQRQQKEETTNHHHHDEKKELTEVVKDEDVPLLSHKEKQERQNNETSINTYTPQNNDEEPTPNDPAQEENKQETKKEDDYNSLQKLVFDPQLALLLEDHLCFILPWCDTSSCCCLSDDEETVANHEEGKEQKNRKTPREPVLKLSPAISFLIYTFLFYIPLIWSSLKPLYFPPKIPKVGNFDDCVWLNSSSAHSNNNNGQAEKDSTTLVAMDFIDCVRCNNNQAYVPLQPALTEMTSVSLFFILFRILVSAGLGCYFFCRTYFERVLSVRLLAFGVLVAPPPKRQYIGDVVFIVACCVGIVYQLAYLETFAPPSLNYVVLEKRCDAPFIMNERPLPDFANQTIIAHFNQSTVDQLYSVSTPEMELFSFCSLMVPFLIGPILSIFKNQEPLALLDSSLAIGGGSSSSSSSVNDDGYDDVTRQEFAKRIVENSKNFKLMYLARISWLKWPRLVCRKRSWCEFWIDSLLASIPMPINYFRRLLTIRACSGDVYSNNNDEHEFWSFEENEQEATEQEIINNVSNNKSNQQQQIQDEQEAKEHKKSSSLLKTSLAIFNIKKFMERELGRNACECYLLSKEEFDEPNHQKWLWIDFGVMMFISLLFVSIYFVAIPPNLTYEDLKSSALLY